MTKQTKAAEHRHTNDEIVSTQEQESEEAHYHKTKTLLEWEAPGRPFRKRAKSYYTTTLVIMFFIEVILFLLGWYMEMLVVASLVFVAFALATVPPHNFHFRISSEGIFIEDHFVLWQELYDFYISRQNTQEVVILRTRSFFPGELVLTHAQDTTVEKIKSTLLPYLPYREYIKPTFVEKFGHWLNKVFPLEPIVSKEKSTPKVAS